MFARERCCMWVLSAFKSSNFHRHFHSSSPSAFNETYLLNPKSYYVAKLTAFMAKSLLDDSFTVRRNPDQKQTHCFLLSALKTHKKTLHDHIKTNTDSHTRLYVEHFKKGSGCSPNGVKPKLLLSHQWLGHTVANNLTSVPKEAEHQHFYTTMNQCGHAKSSQAK